LSAATVRNIKNLSAGTLQSDSRRKVQKISGDFSKLKTKVDDEIAFITEQMETQAPRQQKQETFETSQITAIPYEDDLAEERVGLLARQTQVDAIDNEVDFMSNMINDRDQEIVHIQGQMAQVNEIMKDLADLVNEQGQMIDNIETNVEHTHQNTTEAVSEVSKAAKYQKKARNKLCILAIGTVVAVLIVIIVVVIFIKKK